MKAKGIDAGEGYGFVARSGAVRCAKCGRGANVSHLPRKRRRSALVFAGWQYHPELGWKHSGTWCHKRPRLTC